MSEEGEYLMRKIKRTRLAFWVLLLSIAGGTLAAQGPANLTWKMAFLKWNNTEYEPQTFSRILEFGDGVEFQIYVQAETPAFLYIVKEDANGALALLSRTHLRANMPIFLPAQDDSYTISAPSGTEKIFLVISSASQKNFEKLLDSLTENTGSEAKKTQDILDEIDRIRQSISSLAIEPERPAPMGGVSRGAKKILATEFSGENAYVKTIRIAH